MRAEVGGGEKVIMFLGGSDAVEGCAFDEIWECVVCLRRGLKERKSGLDREIRSLLYLVSDVKVLMLEVRVLCW